MKKILALAAAAAMISSTAFAADIATKAPAYQYPTTKCGFYYGLDTKGSTGSVSNAAVGTQMVQGAIGVTVGYACPVGAGYWYVDADFDFANLNGKQNGLALSGPAMFEQRFGFGVPLNYIAQSIPFLQQLQNALPALPALPGGANIVTSNSGIFLSTTWDDVGVSFGNRDFKTWAFALNVGVETKIRVSNGMVLNPYAEYMIPNTAQCIGTPVVGGCWREKDRMRVGLKWLF